MKKAINELLFWLLHTDKLKYEEKEYIVEYITNLKKEKQELKNVLWQIKELKHEWQDIEENTTLVFENNNLIDFMNKLERLLKLEKENE